MLFFYYCLLLLIIGGLLFCSKNRFTWKNFMFSFLEQISWKLRPILFTSTDISYCNDIVEVAFWSLLDFPHMSAISDGH